MVDSPIPNDAEDPIRRGARFRAARLARGIGQAELGRRVGATQSLIGQIECGRILRSKYETLIMFELGIPLDPETERWILASRRSGAGGAAQGAQDPAPQDAAEQDSAAPPANAHAAAALVPIRPSPADASAAALRRRLATDYQFFAAERLRIRSKGGAIEALVFNRAQRHIHAELEAQRAATGKVRALILKGRQQG
jgi:transcriptional regulator with XRE-family HTH domain